MKSVKKQVKKFKKEFKIKGIPDMSELRQAVKSFHYQLATYERNEELLVSLNQFERSKCVPAFCCTKNRQNYIFYSGKIHDRDLPFVLAHEIGHIYMNHLNREDNIHDTPEYKDREANEFTSELMQESKRDISLKLPFAALLFSVSLLIVSFAISNFGHLSDFKTSIADEPVGITETIDPEGSEELKELKEEKTAVSENKIAADTPKVTAEKPVSETEAYIQKAVTEIVVVTRTGKKYHKPTCWHLKNKTGLRNLKLEQAKIERYTPCSDCFK